MLASLQLVRDAEGGDNGHLGFAGMPPPAHPLPSFCPPSQANDYVVELAQEPGLEQALDTMRLRLLTHRRPHERFHTFQPPSACP